MTSNQRCKIGHRRDRILVTGGGGFIGSHVVDKLVEEGRQVTILDNFDAFYDPAVKARNIERYRNSQAVLLVRKDIRTADCFRHLDGEEYECIIHLAAKAGVGPSVADPLGYYETNVSGTVNLLEFAKRFNIRQFIFASSSSVYGNNARLPWSESESCTGPLSPYAATKQAAEAAGHVYSHLYGISFVSLRLFTVYGPRQRPDLAIHKFTRDILADQTIEIRGDGRASRDYTYVSDVVDAISVAVRRDLGKYEIVNIGSGHPVPLLELLDVLASVLGKTPQYVFVPSSMDEMNHTHANIQKARDLLGYSPRISFEEGIRRFCSWLSEDRRLAVST